MSEPTDPSSPAGEGGQGRDWPHLSGAFEDGIHRLPLRVYYEDTDWSGVVYHAS